MIEISLTVNGKPVRGIVEPRMHLADFLRDQLRLTATHLRCEQGVCGACTLLIDGQPARSCITYAVLCQGSNVTTLEGLQQDEVIGALQRAFSAEHGLQCGYCTPAMLITARDIVTRLPDADAARVRIELSGNLCRCTGYAGIVRAICRVLAERRGTRHEPLAVDAPPLGPVGARRADDQAAAGAAPMRTANMAAALPADADDIIDDADVGLGDRQANFETTVSFTIASPADELWMVLGDVERIAGCMPGATLTEPPKDGRLKGRMTVKFGPIATSFSGLGRVTRDDTRHRGVLYGAGRDRFTGSGVRAEVVYALHPEGDCATRVELTVRALLAGPLAQFGRSGIVQNLVERLAEEFGRQLEHNLATGKYLEGKETALSAGSLLLAALRARIRLLFDRLRLWKRP